MKRVGRAGVAVMMAVGVGLSGCGSSGTKASGAPPSVTQEPTYPEGVFVAAYDGLDTNDGSPLKPLKSINAAIELARAQGKRDVWVYGGGFNGGYAEVVVLQPGVNVHGGICFNDLPPVVTDTENCRSAIVGGSPSLVAIDVSTPTLVENLEIVGLPGVQAGGPNSGFFEVDGIGCIGRGLANGRLPSCERPTDSEGRMAPFSSVAAALSRSNGVYLQNVKLVAGDGASGLDGAEGGAGANGLAPASAGGSAGSQSYMAGAGAKARAPADCAEAKGGNGGQGGRFRWKPDYAWSESGCATNPILCPTFAFQNGFAHGGNDGDDSFLGAGGRAYGPAFTGKQAGAVGTNGGNGPDGQAGDAGLHGSLEIDLVTLVAGEGWRGDAGGSGHGGAGGSGGNPATRLLYSKSSGNSESDVTLEAVGGSTDYAETEELEIEIGEKAGGGGGAGGSGGCGGEGGVGGQGGAASVGLYLVDSTVGFQVSSIETGMGGRGGKGGPGGAGGVGANGSGGGAGQYLGAEKVSGTLTSSSTGGWFELSGTQSYSGSFEDGKSATRSGRGGAGGRGGNGGEGGAGGSGAGGSSIGVVAKGASTVTGLDQVTFVLGEAGAAGESEEAEAGLSVDYLSL